MKKLWCVLPILACLFASALAAQPEDYSYKGVVLGDSREAMLEKAGESRVDIDKTVDGRVITYYFYDRKETKIGIARDTGTVVDIRITNKNYAAKNGVKLGATRHKLLQEYGPAERVFLHGKIYYIYENPQNPEQRLLLDISEGFLAEIRMTSLKE